MTKNWRQNDNAEAVVSEPQDGAISQIVVT
jgi:hypothetical protein